MLIKDGKARAFYDHWGALACTLSLEDGAKRLEKDVPKHYEEVDELMDWAFAEAGFLIDYDERVCIAFGSVDVEVDEIPEEHQSDMQTTLGAFRAGWAEFVAHIEKGWRGYRMIWDDRGVDAFSAHLARRKITSIKTAKPSHPKSYANAKPDVVVVPEAAPKKKGWPTAKRATKKKVS